ncbi:MAG: hypothetical protein JO150_08605, partial [Acidobacteriaceae bacterium]|nr:hypothetical protein [Acidobacteriaceae bacterium]
MNGLLRTNQPLFDRLPLDPLDINTRSIINNFNIDLAAFVIGPESQSSSRGFTVADPDFGSFYSVVARVANQVHQGIFNSLDDGLVQFRSGSVKMKADVFLQRSSHITHDSWQFVPDHANRLHAR